MMTREEAVRLETDSKERFNLDLRVLVVGGGYQYIKMFFDAGFRGADSLDDAHLVCFTGGEDVDPSLYGEKALAGTYFNVARDRRESEIFGGASALGLPMIGICRGGQFLNVLSGGTLWQDVNNHAIHGFHPIVDMRTNETIEGMTSTHHQQMISGKNAEIIALASLSTMKRNEALMEQRTAPELDDEEVVWYPDTKALCFQPHPEFGHGPCRNYFLDLVDEFILPLATEYRDRNIRGCAC